MTAVERLRSGPATGNSDDGTVTEATWSPGSWSGRCSSEPAVIKTLRARIERALCLAQGTLKVWFDDEAQRRSCAPWASSSTGRRTDASYAGVIREGYSFWAMRRSSKLRGWVAQPGNDTGDPESSGRRRRSPSAALFHAKWRRENRRGSLLPSSRPPVRVDSWVALYIDTRPRLVG